MDVEGRLLRDEHINERGVAVEVDLDIEVEEPVHRVCDDINGLFLERRTDLVALALDRAHLVALLCLA